VIAFELNILLNRNYAHTRFAGQQFRKGAFMARVQVLNQNKGHGRLGGQVLQQFGERLQPAC
jgi:hypothetical protein